MARLLTARQNPGRQHPIEIQPATVTFSRKQRRKERKKKKDENENTMPITLYNMVGTLPMNP